MPYYILHRYKGAHHYVCVYVLSDCCDHLRFYYTRHRYKGAHQNVCADVLSDCSEMSYYIYHSNICIQHCVRDVVHSEYPGKSMTVQH